jgi:hypothetical protein
MESAECPFILVEPMVLGQMCFDSVIHTRCTADLKRPSRLIDKFGFVLSRVCEKCQRQSTVSVVLYLSDASKSENIFISVRLSDFSYRFARFIARLKKSE